MDFVFVVTAGGLFAAGLQILLEQAVEAARRAGRRPDGRSPLIVAPVALGLLAAGCAIGLTQLSSLYWLSLGCVFAVLGLVAEPLRRIVSAGGAPRARAVALKLDNFDRWFSPASERPGRDAVHPRDL